MVYTCSGVLLLIFQVLCSELVECCDTMCVASGHDGTRGSHCKGSFRIQSHEGAKRITNGRKLPRCWMKWSMCVRVHFDFCCHRARAQLRANVLSFFFVCKRLCFDLGCKSLHCHPRRPVKFIQGHPWISMDLAFLGWGAVRRVVCVLLACGAYLQRMNCRLTDYYWPILLQVQFYTKIEQNLVCCVLLNFSWVQKVQNLIRWFSIIVRFLSLPYHVF